VCLLSFCKYCTLTICAVTDIVVPPVNKSVTIGDDAWFNCSTDRDGPVTWNRYAPGNATIELYRRGQIHMDYRRRFKVSPAAGGQYDLVISNVQSADEGFYECTDRTGLNESANAYLSAKVKLQQLTTGNNDFSICLRHM